MAWNLELDIFVIVSTTVDKITHMDKVILWQTVQ